MEIFKLEGKLIVNISKVDNGYSVTLIEAPLVGFRKPPTDAEINKKIAEMVKGILDFNKGVNAAAGTAGEDWKRADSAPNLPKLVESFKAMHPNMAEQMKDEICPPQPRIERLVFDSLEKLLSYLAANL